MATGINTRINSRIDDVNRRFNRNNSITDGDGYSVSGDCRVKPIEIDCRGIDCRGIIKKVIVVALTIASFAVLYVGAGHLASVLGISHSIALPVALGGSALYLIFKLEDKIKNIFLSIFSKKAQDTEESRFNLKKLPIDKSDLCFLGVLSIIMACVFLGPHLFVFNAATALTVGGVVALPIIAILGIGLSSLVRFRMGDHDDEDTDDADAVDQRVQNNINENEEEEELISHRAHRRQEWEDMWQPILTE
jgi:hypothetical protein